MDPLDIQPDQSNGNILPAEVNGARNVHVGSLSKGGNS